MSTAKSQPVPACAEPRSLLLPCPCCAEREATISLCLGDGSLTCNECNTEFSAADVHNLIVRWQPVLNWIAMMPFDAPTEEE